MQATLDPGSLRSFTKGMTCLSKYGDEMYIFAAAECLILSATNIAETSYCRFQYSRVFFTRYNVGQRGSDCPSGSQEPVGVSGQVLTKSLLAVLKRGAGDKTVEKCELSIVDPEAGETEEEEDSLESKFVVRMHCKHGVVKTHRLPLHTIESAHQFTDNPGEDESYVEIGAKMLKDIIEHFPSVRGNKGDPQLVWGFANSEVIIRSMETSLDTRGKAQLTTELVLSPEEFNQYHIASVPASIAFQLREFTATVTYADSMNIPTLMRFTEPGRPVVIILETNDTECLFAISTTFDSMQLFPTPQSRRTTASATPQRNPLKRVREDDSAEPGPTPGPSKSASTAVPHSARRKPVKVVQRQDLATARKPSPVAHSVTSSQSVWDSRSMPPPPSVPLRSSPAVPPSPVKQEEEGEEPRQEEPLFLPSSQLTQLEVEMVKHETANITEQELAEILRFDDDELEEFAVSDHKGEDAEVEDVLEIAATQSDHSSDKVFRPLFED
ncbi:hypothetical protein BDM02DRAFT_3260512 [Thelephora ganbajun]|uniref:Uncharacterized protein n=1 Tax=Thelephora ganbajun TaxID=370292 RepID=A0ACB6ZHV7_THEGA|nr:hypothetical protein BDM02DRAFT_3260512 [Thelephora ganbajun]